MRNNSKHCNTCQKQILVYLTAPTNEIKINRIRNNASSSQYRQHCTSADLLSRRPARGSLRYVRFFGYLLGFYTFSVRITWSGWYFTEFRVLLIVFHVLLWPVFSCFELCRVWIASLLRSNWTSPFFTESESEFGIDCSVGKAMINCIYYMCTIS